jgi:hypothetical protein
MSEHDAWTVKGAKHGWSLADKIWLLDDGVVGKALSAVQLGEALAKHANEGRATNEGAAPAPGKSTVNDWVRHEGKSVSKANMYSIFLP